MLSVCRKDVISCSCMKCCQPSHSALHHLLSFCTTKMSQEHNSSQSQFFAPLPLPSHFRLSAHRAFISLAVCCLFSSLSPSFHPFVCQKLLSWSKGARVVQDVCYPSSLGDTVRMELERRRIRGNTVWQDGLQCASITFSHKHTTLQFLHEREKSGTFIRENQESVVVWLFICCTSTNIYLPWAEANSAKSRQKVISFIVELLKHFPTWIQNTHIVDVCILFSLEAPGAHIGQISFRFRI